ncbi:MAG: hypothetical protein JOY90_36515 [Bradyrhizobium sp.]|uniref:hypothetical protein n=1 Tax=Bradyrhizobium sp. TaxID=376 RepID=UPI001DE72AE7|nr:hypothetical protein [Bradyrhizobium sp.]MBV9565916.1 hypothetical protein [Bradyrhizobium sp.]
MATYRIRDLGSRIVVGTEREAVLICQSVAMAEQVVADAKLLETASAKQLFARRPKRAEDE